MTATTIGFFFVMRRVWKVSLAACVALTAGFLVIDGAFLGANVAKIADGGWVPLSVGGGVFGLAMTWRWGRRKLSRTLASRTSPVAAFLARADLAAAHRVAGTEVFLTAAADGIPPILVHHFERVGVLAEQVVLLSVQTLDIPFVEPKRRLAETELGAGFFRVIARFGYAETPSVPAVLEACAIHGLAVDFDRITYVLGRDALRLRHAFGLRSMPRRIFAFLSRNQAPSFGYFGMPIERVIEIGMQLEL